MRRCLVALLALAALLPAPAAALAPATAVTGEDRARLLPPAGAVVEAYAGVGYRLSLAGGEARVAVDVTPLGSRAPYRAPRAWGDDAVARLARAVVAGAETEYAAASRVLGWMARHVAYDLDRAAPQDATAVLARRSGYCTGVARLTVALLAAAGLEAREVAGYVAGDGGGYHRWVEVRLADRGWVMSDPLRTHHYVPATYLRLASERLAVDAGLQGLLLERRDGVAVVDVEPGGPPAVRLLRNEDRQVAAALHVELADAAVGVAVLEDARTRRSAELAAGRATFLGLAPGSYRLRVVAADGASVERRVDVAGRRRTAVRLALPR